MWEMNICGVCSHMRKGERNRSDHLRERKEIYGNKIITATEVEEEKKKQKNEQKPDVNFPCWIFCLLQAIAILSKVHKFYETLLFLYFHFSLCDEQLKKN